MTPKLKSNREVFDFVKAHLLKQNAKSVALSHNDEGEEQSSCLYRGPDGLKCAVGALIDDKFYTPDLEGSWAGDDPVLEAVQRSVGICLNGQFLYQMQQIHDDHPPSEWAWRLEAVDVPA